MKLEIELTDREASLIHTFIRRSLYEQYFRNMTEAGDTKEKAEDRAYETINAMGRLGQAIADAKLNG